VAVCIAKWRPTPPFPIAQNAIQNRRQKLCTPHSKNAYILLLTARSAQITISVALNKKSAQKQKRQTSKQPLLAGGCFFFTPVKWHPLQIFYPH
jgi:hypothetical protein